MNTAVKVKQQVATETKAYQELSKGVVISVAAMSALVGAWGIICLVSALAQFGSGTFTGFFKAIGF